MKTPITVLSGVGPSMAGKLAENGYTCVEDIARSDLKALCSVPGIGSISGERLLASAIALVVEEELPAKEKKGKKKSKDEKKAKGKKEKKSKKDKKSKDKKKSGKKDKKSKKNKD